jgi:upstream activation factor subunit UAF30
MKFKSLAQRKAVMAMLRKKGIKQKPITYEMTGRYHRFRLAPADKFQRSTFRTIDPGKPGGMKLVIGRPKGSLTTRTQSVLIPKGGKTYNFSDNKTRTEGLSKLAKFGGKAFGGFVINPDKELADVIGSKPVPPSVMTKGIWSYIKANKLSRKNPKKKGLAGFEIVPDEKLGKVIGTKPMAPSQMTKAVWAHIKKSKGGKKGDLEEEHIIMGPKGKIKEIVRTYE